MDLVNFLYLLIGFACGLAYSIIYDRWIKDDDE